MCEIYGELIKNGFDCSWLDILKYRESHPCSPEQALHALISLYKQKHSTNPYGHECYPRCSLLETGEYFRNYYGTSGHLTYDSPFYGQFSDGCSSVFQGANPSKRNILCQKECTKRCISCQKDYNCATVPKTSVNSSVSTAQLTGLPPNPWADPYFSESNHLRNNVESRECSTNSNERPVSTGAKQKPSKDITCELWRYPVKSSECRKPQKQTIEKVTVDEVESNLRKFSLSEPKLSYSAVTKGLGKKCDKVLDVNKVPSKKKNKGDVTSTSQNSSVLVQTLGREQTRKLDPNYMTLRVKLNDKWECSACTFHNLYDKEVCEMCSKSRLSGNESPLTSGGRQCPQCTLVNIKGVTICDACGANLKDSPTYI